MNQEVFVRRHEERWQDLHELLSRMETNLATTDRLDRFAPDYRRLCQQLAVARHRHYSTDVVERLNGLVLRAHSQMYGTRGDGLARQARRLLIAFPAAVRREWKLVLAAHLLFYLPYLGMMAAVIGWPELVQTVLPPDDLARMEWMYDPASDHFLNERALDSDLLMFGFYIYNNIGIAFRTFAGGLLGGVGSLFFLVYNGVALGTASGHLTSVGFGSTFWSFVITHGAFELTAIVLSGAAGLKLGMAVLVPGNRTRRRALSDAVTAVLPILYGFFAFLVAAAFLEAFWSSSRLIATPVKYGVGTAAWLWVYTYLLIAGRENTEVSDGS